MARFFQHTFTVPQSALDRYGHVNNVVYVQWMHDIAVLHSDQEGWTELTHGVGAAWFARSHRIEYLRPTFSGDRVTAVTWIADVGTVTSVRKYRFFRKADNTVLAEGETTWAFVDLETGLPREIPRDVATRFKESSPPSRQG